MVALPGAMLAYSGIGQCNWRMYIQYAYQVFVLSLEAVENCKKWRHKIRWGRLAAFVPAEIYHGRHSAKMVHHGYGERLEDLNSLQETKAQN